MSELALHPAIRGALGRCPRCGDGRLFEHYLKVVASCSVCGEPYGHYRPDDAAPWLTILLVAHLVVPIVLLIETEYQPPPWIEFAFYLPLLLALTLILLPRCKGVIIAALWMTKAEGSERR